MLPTTGILKGRFIIPPRRRSKFAAGPEITGACFFVPGLFIPPAFVAHLYYECSGDSPPPNFDHNLPAPGFILMGKKPRGAIVMARPKKAVDYTAELMKVEEQIQKSREQLRRLEQRRKELQGEKEQRELGALYQVVQESGKSLEEVRCLLQPAAGK